MKQYTVIFSEQQRRILLDSLEPHCYADDATLQDELEILRRLIRDIPTVESREPGVIHGLCL